VIAEGLARIGASVVVNGRTQERVDTALREIRALLAQATKSKVIPKRFRPTDQLLAFLESL
jgi:NAD(P)-dependent dehydrogenase (short-subunit alcohol dehydrogenase family)